MLSDAVVLASGAQTVTFNGDDQRAQGKGVLLQLDITAVAGTAPTLNIKVQTKDPGSGKYQDLPDASFAAKSATGQDSLIIYPGVVAVANRRVSSVLSAIYRLVYTIGGTGPSFTFSVGATYLP